MKIQPLMALVALSLPMVPGARAAVRGFTARTLGLLTLACLLVAAPATAQVNSLIPLTFLLIYVYMRHQPRFHVVAGA